MEVNERLGAYYRLEKGNIVLVLHEEILGEDSWAAAVAEDIEVFLEVGISVGVVFSDAVAGQLGRCNFVLAGSQGVGLCLPRRRGVGRPPLAFSRAEAGQSAGGSAGGSRGPGLAGVAGPGGREGGGAAALLLGAGEDGRGRVCLRAIGRFTDTFCYSIHY